MKNCFKVIEAATVLYVLDLSARNLWKLVILKTALFESRCFLEIKWVCYQNYTHHVLLFQYERLISKLAGRCDPVFNNAAPKPIALCLFALTVLTYCQIIDA